MVCDRHDDDYVMVKDESTINEVGILFNIDIEVEPTPKASPLTVQPTLGGFAPMLNSKRPFGSLVRNLNDMVPVFTASHFGNIWNSQNGSHYERPGYTESSQLRNPYNHNK